MVDRGVYFTMCLFYLLSLPHLFFPSDTLVQEKIKSAFLSVKKSFLLIALLPFARFGWQTFSSGRMVTSIFVLSLCLSYSEGLLIVSE